MSVRMNAASLTTILALVFALCGASVPASEVKHVGPTGAKELGPDGVRVVPQYLEDIVAERVVGGEEAQPNAWPWQISLQALLQGRYRHFCGATLINESWAMTAAHCVDRPWNKLRAVAGEHDLHSDSGREQVVNVREVHIHPRWNGDVSNGNDIALVDFDSDMILNQWVQPAALPPAGQILPDNTPCYITGWGVTHPSNAEASRRLMQAYLPLIDHQTCSRPDWWGQIVKTTMICAGGNGAQAACYGDSGGPLNCEMSGTYIVHGVTSFAPTRCNVPKRPNGFARVSEYIDWIDQTTN